MDRFFNKKFIGCFHIIEDNNGFFSDRPEYIQCSKLFDSKEETKLWLKEKKNNFKEAQIHNKPIIEEFNRTRPACTPAPGPEWFSSGRIYSKDPLFSVTSNWDYMTTCIVEKPFWKPYWIIGREVAKDKTGYGQLFEGKCD